jgi:hypothetical protein
MADTLTDADYQWLYKQGRSENPADRAEVTALVKKMTPEENQAYNTYQKAQTAPPSKKTSILGVPVTMVGDQPRPDSNMIGTDEGQGIAPEDALMGAQAGRMILRSVTGAGGTAAKVGAGLKATMSQAAPAIKYELAKTTLEKMGVPSPLASMAAMAFSAWSPNGPSAPNVPDPVPAAGPKPMPPVPAGIGRPNTLSSKDLTKVLTIENAAKAGNVKPDLAATLQAAPTAEAAAPAVRPTGPILDPAAQSVRDQTGGAYQPPATAASGKIAPKIYNELAIWAKRAGMTLKPEEEAAAAQLVHGGATTAPGAVTAIKALRESQANPAQALLDRGIGVSEDQMNADMASRAVRGQKSLMPKYGKQTP